MMKRTFIILGGAALLGVLFWKRNEVADAADSAGESFNDIGETFVEKIESVYYATTQNSKANEEFYAPAIAEAESKYSIPTGLLHRQLYQESRFRTDIISGQTISAAGAIGIAQIVPKWHPTVDPYDPFASIDYAGKIMRGFYRRFGSWSLALAAYNAGEGNVAKYGGIPPFEETQKYVSQITNDVGVA